MERKRVLGLVAIGGALALLGWTMREKIAEVSLDLWAGLTGKKQAFVKRYVEAWAKTSKRLPLELLMPQAAFESAWGTDYKATKYNNLHGRMGSGNAGSIPGTGKEWNPATGQYEIRPTKWAAWTSWEAAIEDQYDYLLRPGGRYLGPYFNTQKKEQAPGLKNVSTVREAWRSMVAAGYATEPTEPYVKKTAATAADLRLNPDTPLRVA